MKFDSRGVALDYQLREKNYSKVVYPSHSVCVCVCVPALSKY